MKIFSKTSGWLLAFLLLSFTACNNSSPDPSPESETQKTLVKTVFNYTDGSSDQSRIILLEYAPDGTPLRTTTNLQITGPITLSEGNYGVVEIFNDAEIEIAGEITFGNINPNNNKPVRITIRRGATLNLSSSLNQNGKFVFYNYGTLNTGNHEMQNGKNDFFNYGTHNVTGDLQISSGDSQYNNCGFLNVSNYTNFHAGRYHACECGQLITNGLNVNGSNKVTGKGFIKVTGNLNLNGFLTESKDIEFCYTGHINQPEKIGAAKRTCEPTCKPNPLPVKYTNLKAEAFKSSEGVKGRISFVVTENSNLLNMKIMISTDGRNWKEQLSETEAAFKVGQEYIGVFSLK